MKKIYAALALSALMATGAKAQDQAIGEKQLDSVEVRPLIPIQKQNLLGRTDLIVSARLGGDAYFGDDGFEAYKWRMVPVMFELKSQLTDRTSFRFRHRVSSWNYETAPTSGQSQDRVNTSTDLAFVKVNVTKKWDVAIGKIYLDWGGWEFDYNPINIFRYSEYQDNGEVFLTGFTSWYQINADNSLTFQVLNNSAYGGRVQPYTSQEDIDAGVIASKAPMAYLVNWRNSAFDGKLLTSASYTMFNPAKNYYNSFFVIGASYRATKKLNIQFDYNYAYDQIDRTNLITNYMGAALDGTTAQGIKYATYWTKWDYKLIQGDKSPSVKLFFVGFYSDAAYNGPKNGGNLQGTLPTVASSEKYYSTFCYNPGIEVMPNEEKFGVLRFYVTYIGQNYKFTDYAKNNFGNENYKRNQFSMGLIAPLTIF